MAEEKVIYNEKFDHKGNTYEVKYLEDLEIVRLVNVGMELTLFEALPGCSNYISYSSTGEAIDVLAKAHSLIQTKGGLAHDLATLQEKREQDAELIVRLTNELDKSGRIRNGLEKRIRNLRDIKNKEIEELKGLLDIVKEKDNTIKNQRAELEKLYSAVKERGCMILEHRDEIKKLKDYRSSDYKTYTRELERLNSVVKEQESGHARFSSAFLAKNNTIQLLKDVVAEKTAIIADMAKELEALRFSFNTSQAEKLDLSRSYATEIKTLKKSLRDIISLDSAVFKEQTQTIKRRDAQIKVLWDALKAVKPGEPEDFEFSTGEVFEKNPLRCNDDELVYERVDSLEDADMESAGVAEWKAGFNASLDKATVSIFSTKEEALKALEDIEPSFTDAHKAGVALRNATPDTPRPSSFISCCQCPEYAKIRANLSGDEDGK